MRNSMLGIVFATIFALSLSAQPFAYITVDSTPYSEPCVSLVVFNLADNTAMTPNFCVGSTDAITVSPDGKRVAFTTWDSLFIFETATEILSKVKLDNPREIAISADSQFAYVTGSVYGAGKVWAVNMANGGEIVATITVGGFPKGITMSPDGSKAYVVGCWIAPKQLCVIDTATNTLSDKLTATGADGVVITPDGKKIYKVDDMAAYNAVQVVDVASGQARSMACNECFLILSGNRIVISPDGSKVYLTGLSKTSVINTSTDRIAVGPSPTGSMAISPDSKKLFVISGIGGGNQIWVVNTETNEVVDLILLPQVIQDKVYQMKRIVISAGPTSTEVSAQ